MARYDFLNGGGILAIVIQSQGGLYNPQSMALAVPSLTLTNEIIKIYDSGLYFNSYVFTDFGLIDGVQPVDINEAYDLLTALIGAVITTGGGTFAVGAGPAATFSSTSGNTVNVTAITGSGVYSTSVDGPGVEAFSVNDPGVLGYSQNASGVFAHSQTAVGLVVDSLNLANNSDIANFNRNNITQVRITSTGKLILKASDTASASLTIPVGVAPTAPIDGEIWLESNTLTGLKIRIGGVTRTVTLT